MRVGDASELPPHLRKQVEEKLSRPDGAGADDVFIAPPRTGMSILAVAPKAARQSAGPSGKTPDDREHREQVEFVTWVQTALPGLAECMTAVPHGGHRRKGVAGKLVAEGVRRGYPDVLFDVPRGPWHGLRVEMKAEDGVVSDDQLAWISRLLRHGYLAVVAENAEHAKRIALDYWQLGPYRTPETT